MKLLGADKSTVISEYSSSPTEDRSRYSRAWKEVSRPPPRPRKNPARLRGAPRFLSVRLPAGVTRVLQLRAGSEIRPLPTQAEEHVPERLPPDHVQQQHSDR